MADFGGAKVPVVRAQGLVRTKERLLAVGNADNLDSVGIALVNDPVVAFDQLAQVAIPELGHHAAGIGEARQLCVRVVIESIRPVADSGENEDRRSKIRAKSAFARLVQMPFKTVVRVHTSHGSHRW